MFSQLSGDNKCHCGKKCFPCGPRPKKQRAPSRRRATRGEGGHVLYGFLSRLRDGDVEVRWRPFKGRNWMKGELWRRFKIKKQPGLHGEIPDVFLTRRVGGASRGCRMRSNRTLISLSGLLLHVLVSSGLLTYSHKPLIRLTKICHYAPAGVMAQLEVYFA